MFSRITFSSIIVVAFLFLGTANAQFIAEHSYLGPCIGLSFLGSVPQFGVNYERSMDLQNLGSVGFGGVFRYWGYSEDFGYGKVSYTNILIGAQGNYHFKVPGNSNLDPYAGVVLAYDIGSSSVDYNNAFLNGYSASVSAGGFWAAVQGGVRYFIQPNLALTGRLAFGSLSYGGLEVGVDFKF